MWLDEWLFKEKKTITEFAKELQVTRDHLNKIVRKTLKSGKRLARDIEDFTKGEVTSRDILNVKLKEKKT